MSTTTLETIAILRADFLCDWLNGPGEQRWEAWTHHLVGRYGPSRKRLSPAVIPGLHTSHELDAQGRAHILKLLRGLRECARIGKLLNWQQSPANDPLGWKKHRDYAGQVSKVLRRYSGRITYSLKTNQPVQNSNGLWSPLMMPGETMAPVARILRTKASNISIQEQMAFDHITELWSNGEIDLLRECVNPNCRRWFFARKRDQFSHDRKCFRQVYYTSEEYKQKRRKKYREERDQEQRWIGKAPTRRTK